MTKEEVIKEAYGKYWEQVKGFVDENGRFLKYFRPISLDGIENNNGWIKIESEEDLPKKTIYYNVLRNRMFQNARYAGNNRWFTQGRDYPLTTEKSEITHYRIIEIPEPPIY